MNIPINCPICGDPLVNTFNETTDKVVYKNCRLRPDHIFSCAVYLPGFMDTNEGRVERIAFTLSMSPILSVEVNFRIEQMNVDKCAPLHVASVTGSSQKLPFYVEPDFSDYKKLCNKIKTYILFS